MTEITPACARPTRKYPAGLTGTANGWHAHRRSGEKACDACRGAYSSYMAAYQNKHRDRIAAYNRDRRDDRQQIIDGLKSVPCADCGRTFPPVCMDFDHLTDKRFDISRAFTRSLKTVLAEIAKCEVVCANCHRIRTAARLVRKYPKKGAAS